MNAIVVQEDKALAWTPVPDPVRRDGEVNLEVYAAGVNRADLMQRAGSYPPPPGWPEWMGLEAAGVITDAPAGGRWKPGDRVCALLGGGGCAERVAVPAELVMPIPPGLSMVEAAAIPEAFATAWLNLCLEGGMKAGETVFIQAGASGLGMAAIQLAKAFEAKVVTTVGSEAKARFVRDLGADVVIDRGHDDIAAVLARNPPDIALDCVAGPALGACLKTMARGGRWIVIATLGGTACDLDMGDFFRRGIRLIGSTLRSRSNAVKARVLADLEQRLWADLSARRLRVAIHRALPIARAAEAHDILESRANLGKVVLTVKEERR
ncbi:MAG: NAD(P)H-quinone oxidoreductase [Lentisphaerae bacterium]|nr:NAD(P)H-quinone oxidoreductase [Lentisphaerota bacterium]